MARSEYMIVLGFVAALIAAIAGYIYLFGIPPSMKRWAEEQALDKMGENKASYMTKSAVDKLPESDSDQVQGVRKDVKNVVGSGLQNPLGKFAGNTADDATKPATGR